MVGVSVEPLVPTLIDDAFDEVCFKRVLGDAHAFQGGIESSSVGEPHRDAIEAFGNHTRNDRDRDRLCEVFEVVIIHVNMVSHFSTGMNRIVGCPALCVVQW